MSPRIASLVVNDAFARAPSLSERASLFKRLRPNLYRTVSDELADKCVELLSDERGRILPTCQTLKRHLRERGYGFDPITWIMVVGLILQIVRFFRDHLR